MSKRRCDEPPDTDHSTAPFASLYGTSPPSHRRDEAFRLLRALHRPFGRLDYGLCASVHPEDVGLDRPQHGRQ